MVGSGYLQAWADWDMNGAFRCLTSKCLKIILLSMEAKLFYSCRRRCSRLVLYKLDSAWLVASSIPSDGYVGDGS
ncbi:hypothetical protein O9929_24085 [Vibrio lentus]|nr:hypothetical protein [Vibrio lentus]